MTLWEVGQARKIAEALARDLEADPRGKDAARIARIIAELLRDTKERSED